MHNTTIDTAEVEKFSRQAGQWWDERGPFAPLHRMNPVRVQYILNRVTEMQKYRNAESGNICISASPHSAPLAGVSLLDIGCGGGLMTEPLARLGARVTGIDASEENIETAKLHAAQTDLSIDYRRTTAESLVASRQSMAEKTIDYRLSTIDCYDVVLALEIIEHVADIPAFITAASALAKPGGVMIFSTINRTAKSFALAILGAEYVLQLVPRGTHEWEKFVRPHELAAGLRKNNSEVTDVTGTAYNPFSGQWRLIKDSSVNYFMTARKI